MPIQQINDEKINMVSSSSRNPWNGLVDWRISSLGRFALNDCSGLSEESMLSFPLLSWRFFTGRSAGGGHFCGYSTGSVNGVSSGSCGWITGDRSRAFGITLVGLIYIRILLYIPPLRPLTWWVLGPRMPVPLPNFQFCPSVCWKNTDCPTSISKSFRDFRSWAFLTLRLRASRVIWVITQLPTNTSPD